MKRFQTVLMKYMKQVYPAIENGMDLSDEFIGK